MLVIRMITFILDNGSTDGTQIWLQNQKFHHVTLLPSNIGISAEVT